MNETARTSDPNWSRRVVAYLVLLGVLGGFGLLLAAFLPRWWAQRVGDQVGGSITTGVFVGLFYGFVFTLVPLALLWLAFRVLDSWKPRGAALAGAVLLAAPNLLTLEIAVGEGSGAHAGQRILDVEGPGFRGATLAGALTAVGCLAAAWYLLASRRRAWSRAAERTEEKTGPPTA